MTKEQHLPQPEGFGLTENEKLFDRISDTRFQTLIFNDRTTIHEIKADSNSYGEFLLMSETTLRNYRQKIQHRLTGLIDDKAAEVHHQLI